MAGQSRKWVILVAVIWIQAFTGTNFDFSAYSSEMKKVLGISQVQLNYLAVASDMGKVFGWSSGLALMHFPLWVVLFIAAFMGLFGYGIQWLVITNVISLPYILVCFLCLLSGCSICWFNTVCFVLCIKSFPANRALALSLTVSYNGVSAALYALAGGAINASSSSLYLLLNSLVPLIVSIAALVPILRQPLMDLLPPEARRSDSVKFLILNVLAVLTGVYLLIFASNTSDAITTARLLLGGAIVLLVFPLCVPGVVYARRWFHNAIHSSVRYGSGFLLVDDDDLEVHKRLLRREGSFNSLSGSLLNDDEASEYKLVSPKECSKEDEDSTRCCEKMMEKDHLFMLGEEHSARVLVRRLDFWLYFITYFCGGTIGLVYSNNLGQIAQSLGHSSNTTLLLTLYSSSSFFGRLLSAAPDYVRAKFYFARTGWLTIALLPTPVAFFLLAAFSDSTVALRIGTALIGLSSGFIFAAAVSVTSELFGPKSVGVNHNILITNIPIGSLVYGMLAAEIYDGDAGGLKLKFVDSVVCMGRQCYFLTFVSWGCLSVLGLLSSLLLFLRTKHAYDAFEWNRNHPLAETEKDLLSNGIA